MALESTASGIETGSAAPGLYGGGIGAPLTIGFGDYGDTAPTPAASTVGQASSTPAGSGSLALGAPITAATGLTGGDTGDGLSSGAGDGQAGVGASTDTIGTAGSGIVFNNTFEASVSNAYKNNIIAAEQTIQGLFNNNVTLNMDFNAQMKGTSTFLATNSWNSWTIVTYAQLKAALPAFDSLPASDPAPSGSNHWYIPEAYARMLGLNNSTPTTDDTVTLNTSYSWNYGQDVTNTLIHEISEGAMGRVGGLGDQNNVWSTMDLFRFSSPGVRDYTDGRDNATTFFSFDGQHLSSQSYNNEFNGATQVNTGDTADFNVFDVFGFGNPGETNSLSTTDIQVLDALGWHNQPPPPTTPAGTTADLILRDIPGANSGQLDVFDIGSNGFLAAYAMGSVGFSWGVMGIGGFAGNPNEADMIMHDSNTGTLEFFDIQSSQIVNAGSMGSIGAEWQTFGVGNFSGNTNETDMVIHDTAHGGLYYFDIQHNQIAALGSMGSIGAEWQSLGAGDFSSIAGETDILMRDTQNGALYYLDIQHNQLVGLGSMGTIGLEWQALGVGNFSDNANETDLLMRDSQNGAIYVFDVRNNQFVGINAMGSIGAEWQSLGVGDISGIPGENDLMMRDTQNGAIYAFDIQHNQFVNVKSMGAIGVDWQNLGVGTPLVPGSPLV